MMELGSAPAPNTFWARDPITGLVVTSTISARDAMERLREVLNLNSEQHAPEEARLP